MKKNYTDLILIGFVLGISTVTKAQVRIVNSAENTAAPNSSAFIDASSNVTLNSTSNIGKGLLFPRTNLTLFSSFGGLGIGSSGSYPNYYDGFIVYNTAASGVAGVGSTDGTLTAGYWYYDNKSTTITGGTWKPLIPPVTIYTGSASIALNGDSFERAALTGDITALANSNATMISANAVTSAKIADGTIVATDIADGAVTSVKIQGSTTNGQVLTTNASGVTSWATLTAASEVDGIIGNEVMAATVNGGLLRAGAGTSASPYTLGLTTGTVANQVMKWNGTAWAPGTDDNTADNLGNHTATTTLNMNGKGISNILNYGTAANAAAAGTILWNINNASNSMRWGVGINNVEGTNNLGTDFTIWSYTNTGAFLGSPFTIQRSSGNTIIGNQIQIVGGAPGNGKVLTSDANGLATWSTPSNTTYTSGNGITLGGTNFTLGGSLTGSTTINTDSGALSLIGGNKFTVASSGTNAGKVLLSPGTMTSSGHIEIWKGGANTRLGYIGFDNTNLSYNAENGAIHVFNSTIQAPSINVDGQIKISGGIPGAGKVLTSDANGLATWSTPAAIPAAQSTLYTADGTIATNRTVTLGNNNLNFAGSSNTVTPIQITGGPSEYGANAREFIKMVRPLNPGVNSAVYGGIKLGTQGNNTVGRMDFSVNSDANASANITPLTITGQGFVGINKTDPSVALDVNGQIKISGGTPGAGKVLTSDASGLATWAAPSTPAAQATLYTADGTLASGRTVYANNNILNILGTNASSGPLQLTAKAATSGAQTTEVLKLYRPATAGVIDGQAASLSLGTSGGSTGRLDIKLTSSAQGGNNWGSTPDTTPMTILATGMVGINKTNPTSPLDVNGSANINGGVNSYNSASNTGSVHLSPGSTTTAGFIGFMNPQGVRIGRIGWDLPNLQYVAEAGGIHVFNTTIQAPRIQGSSDRRFKENIKPIYQATEKLNQLSGYTYTWKDKKDFPGQVLGEGKDMGVIAQEVEAVFPDVVSTNKDGYKSVNYNALIPVLIEALKESNKKIKDLEKRITTLELKK